MALYVCFGIAVAIGLLLLFIPNSGKRKARADKFLSALGIIALFSVASFGTTLLIAVQGNPYAETELISSKQIEHVSYSESSTRRGNLIGNYTYRIAREDGEGDRFFVSESVPSTSMRLYIEEELDGSRIEQYQGYWYEPNVFPWRIWSFQPYRLYSTEDPR